MAFVMISGKHWEIISGEKESREFRAEETSVRSLFRNIMARTNHQEHYKGCKSYEDFRELLEKESDINAIKIMTPDHLHATVAIASMKKGKHVVTHKPIANRMHEAKLTIDTGQKERSEHASACMEPEA